MSIASLEGLMAALADVVSGLDADSLSPRDAAAAVAVFVRGENLCAAGKALCAERATRAGEHRRCGHTDAAGWLAEASGDTKGRARDLLETAGALSSLSGLEGALRAGELSLTQARTIAEAASADPAAEKGLLELSRHGSLGELRDSAEAIKAAARSKDDEARRYEALLKGRHLRSFTGRDGGFKGQLALTPDAGARLLAVLQPASDFFFDEARRQGRREPHEAYLADALVAVVTGEWPGEEEPGGEEDLCEGSDDEADAGGGALGGGGQPAGVGAPGGSGSAGGGQPAGVGARHGSGSAGGGRPGVGAPGGSQCQPVLVSRVAGGRGPDDEATGSPGGSGGSDGRAGGSDDSSGGSPGRAGGSDGDCAPTGDGGDSPSGAGGGSDPALKPGGPVPGGLQPPQPANGPGRARRGRRPRSQPPSATVICRVDLAALRRGSLQAGESCEIPGVGPVPLAVARQLFGDCFLKFVVADGIDVKMVLHYGRTIPAHLKTALQFRDRCCVVPGCGRSFGLEYDHIVEFAKGGPTTLENLCRLCAPHHAMKTHKGYRIRGGPGHWEWRAPASRAEGGGEGDGESPPGQESDSTRASTMPAKTEAPAMF